MTSGSGGTDVCSGLVGGVVNLPIHAGEIQARQPRVTLVVLPSGKRRFVREYPQEGRN